MRGWRAWNADGESVSSAETSRQSLPGPIVGVVVYLDPPYRRILDGHDWVWLEDGELQCDESGEWGSWNPRPQVGCAACLKQGAGVEDALWTAIKREMAEAMTWPA